jgi:hypothetical protein
MEHQLHIVGHYIENMNVLWKENCTDNQVKIQKTLQLCYTLISLLTQTALGDASCQNDVHTQGYEN